MVLSFPLFHFLSSPFLFLVCSKRELSCRHTRSTNRGAADQADKVHWNSDEEQVGFTICDLRQTARPAGETQAFRDGRLLALAWKAESKKAPLIMLSSSSFVKPVSVTTRRGMRDTKPAVVNSYNHSMKWGRCCRPTDSLLLLED